MIETSEQAYQAIEQMGRMQRILESCRNEIMARNPRNFAILAEGPLEQIRQLQAQLDEYVQRLEGPSGPLERQRTGATGQRSRQNASRPRREM